MRPGENRPGYVAAMFQHELLYDPMEPFVDVFNKKQHYIANRIEKLEKLKCESHLGIKLTHDQDEAIQMLPEVKKQSDHVIIVLKMAQKLQKEYWKASRERDTAVRKKFEQMQRDLLKDTYSIRQLLVHMAKPEIRTKFILGEDGAIALNPAEFVMLDEMMEIYQPTMRPLETFSDWENRCILSSAHTVRIYKSDREQAINGRSGFELRQLLKKLLLCEFFNNQIFMQFGYPGEPANIEDVDSADSLVRGIFVVESDSGSLQSDPSAADVISKNLILPHDLTEKIWRERNKPSKYIFGFVDDTQKSEDVSSSRLVADGEEPNLRIVVVKIDTVPALVDVTKLTQADIGGQKSPSETGSLQTSPSAAAPVAGLTKAQKRRNKKKNKAAEAAAAATLSAVPAVVEEKAAEPIAAPQVQQVAPSAPVASEFNRNLYDNTQPAAPTEGLLMSQVLARTIQANGNAPFVVVHPKSASRVAQQKKRPTQASGSGAGSSQGSSYQGGQQNNRDGNNRGRHRGMNRTEPRRQYNNQYRERDYYEEEYTYRAPPPGVSGLIFGGRK